MPNIIEKPWGFEELLFAGKHYAVKVIAMTKNEMFSLQQHSSKQKTIYLMSGKIKLIRDSNINRSAIVVVPGICHHIDAGIVHRIEALEPSRFIEVSSVHDNDETIRIEDKYGRVSDGAETAKFM